MSARILINCKWQSHKHLTGVQRYSAELIEALSESGLAFECASPAPGPPWKQTLWEQRKLPKLAREYDTLLCPANMAPAKLPREIRLVLTIHCLRFRVHPESYSRGFAAWYRHIIPRLIARADTILAVSQTTANEIQRAYPDASGKLRVVYPGVSAAFGAKGPAGDPSIDSGAYWVFMGNATPAKNLGVLLRAMSEARKPQRLVLLGVSTAQLNAAVAKTCDAARIAGFVRPLGHINDTSRVASILRGATGLLAPSLYESFDLPAIEAMACGRAVIASDTPVHREICGDAAVFVSPRDGAAWATEMDLISGDPEKAHRLADAGMERSGRFDWKKAASEISSLLLPTGIGTP